MKKLTRYSVRFDENLSLQIKELSEMLKHDASTIIRALCIHSINQIQQDEKGNWKLPKSIIEQKEVEAAGKRQDNEDISEQLETDNRKSYFRI